MKKRFILSIVAVGLLLSACNGKENVPKEEGSANGVSSYEVTESSADDEESISKGENKVVFTEMRGKQVKDYLKSATYAEILQTMSNADKNGVEFAKATYDVEVNTDTNVEIVTITENRDGEEKTTVFADDFNNDYHYSKSGNQWWVEDDARTLVIDWNLPKFHTIQDVFDIIVGGNFIAEGTEGEYREGYDVYEVVDQATTLDITNIDYDTLGNKTITYMFEEQGNFYKPVSIVIKVDFTLSGREYCCTSAIQFLNVSTKDLKMPEELHLKDKAGNGVTGVTKAKETEGTTEKVEGTTEEVEDTKGTTEAKETEGTPEEVEDTKGTTEAEGE